MAIAENQCGDGSVLDYTALTSCITISCQLVSQKPTLIGSHLVLAPLKIDEMLGKLNQLKSGRGISNIYVVGCLDYWGSGNGVPASFDPSTGAMYRRLKAALGFDGRVQSATTGGFGDRVSVDFGSPNQVRVKVNGIARNDFAGH